MFKHAIVNSPNKRVDIAVANAGIGSADDVFFQNRWSLPLAHTTNH